MQNVRKVKVRPWLSGSGARYPREVAAMENEAGELIVFSEPITFYQAMQEVGRN